MAAAVVALGVVVGALLVVVMGLLRSHADILRALADLGASLDPDAPRTSGAGGAVVAPVGTTRASDLTGVGLDGEPLSVGVLGASHTTFVVFLSTTCSTCRPFWEALSAGGAAPPGSRVVVVVQEEEDPPAVARLAGPRLAVIRSTQAWRDYGVPGSPHVVRVEPNGAVGGEGTGSSWAQVLDLLGAAHRRGRSPAPLPPLPPRPRTPAPRGSGGWRGDRDNSARIDAELRAAGVAAGDPQLYPGVPPGGALDAARRDEWL